ncbi:MAG: sulfotransferase family protein [Candidatus Binatia bacterium]
MLTRAINAAGGALRTLGLPLVGLGEAALLAEASRRTRLEDFGDDAFRDPLRRLLRALEVEAHPTLLGRVIARRDILRLLENRLRMTAELRRHPDIETGPITAPLFIVGLPRTGTSILHELMAQDPAHRVPMTWEVMHPWPPPEAATFDTDPRIAAVERHFAGIDRVLPDFKKIHPMGARLPQECVALTAHDFATMIFHTTHRVPSYQAWLEAANLEWVYASHRRQLQYLQWKAPATRWVLKSPGHLWALGALLAVYPDARIVQTHRDPLKVIASLTSLVTVLRSLASDRIDPLEIAHDWTERLARGLEHTLRVRAERALPATRVFDLHFGEFMGDQIGMVRRIYTHFDMPLSAQAEAGMRRFLAENAVDKHGRHTYTLAAAGLDVDVERRRYARYTQHFGIAAEAMP